jgi:hypothetical protein
LKRALLCALVAGAGCWSPSYVNGGTRCDTTAPHCPSGFACVDVLGTCWRDGELPDLGGLDFSGVDFAGVDLAGAEAAVPRHISVMLMHGGPGVHEDDALTITASLTQLLPSDTGRATFSSADGSFTGVMCALGSPGSGECTAQFHPLATGQPHDVVVSATSVDDGSSGMDTVHVVPPIAITFSPARVDVLAFGTPETAMASATAVNLLSGEDATITLSVVGNPTPPPSITGQMVTINVAAQPFPLPSPSPPPYFVHAVFAAQPSRTADLPVSVHGFVDESPQVQALLQSQLGTNQAMLVAGALNSSGDLMVGGELFGPSPAPRALALVRTASTGHWDLALNGFFSQEGAVTGVAVEPSGAFILIGVYDGGDSRGNQQVVLKRCSGTPPQCNDDTVPSLGTGYSAFFAGLWASESNGITSEPVTSNPHIVTFISPTGIPSVLVTYQLVSTSPCFSGGQLMTAAASYFLLGTTTGVSPLTFAGENTAAAPNNSCPFGTSPNDSRAYLGATASSSGDAIWLGGVSGSWPSTASWRRAGRTWATSPPTNPGFRRRC